MTDAESASYDRGVSAEFDAVEIGPPPPYPTPILLLFIIIQILKMF